ncbi:MAG: hypothetical protein OXK20_09615, partial [Deltaproteobacteria bacterium]|nr:hypothetical protein [Deltaproteobacteria bacterium]
LDTSFSHSLGVHQIGSTPFIVVDRSRLLQQLASVVQPTRLEEQSSGPDFRNFDASGRNVSSAT